MLNPQQPPENQKTSRHNWRLIALITTAGMLLRLVITFTAPMGWDGGTIMYWAALLNQGATPYRDFFLRDPVYVYLVALSMKIFGTNYLAISLASILPSTGTIVMIYLVTCELFDHSTATISSLLYSISPTIVWYSTVFDPHTLMLFLASTSILILIKGLKTNKPRYLAIFGIILGAGVFAYRGIAIYAPTSLLLLAYFAVKKRWPGPALLAWLKKALTIGVPFIIVGISILLVFSLFSSLSWMLSTFGFGGQQESASYFILGEVLNPRGRARLLFVAVREWLYLLVPALALLITPLAKSFRTRKARIATISVPGAAALVTLAWGSQGGPVAAYGAYEPAWEYNLGFWLLFPLLAGSCILLLASTKPWNPDSSKSTYTYPVLAYWFLSTALLVGLFGIPLVNYYYFFAPVLAITAAPIIKAALKHARVLETSLGVSSQRVKPILFLSLLVASSLTVAAMLPSTYMTWRNRSMTATLQIASYIQQNTAPNDEILVQDPSIALFAHRKVALGIALTLVYNKNGTEPFNPMPYDPFHLFPNVTEIANYMATGNVKYVVGDYLVCGISIHPAWKQTFQTYYKLETTIDGNAIFVFTPNGGTAQASCAGLTDQPSLIQRAD